MGTLSTMQSRPVVFSREINAYIFFSFFSVHLSEPFLHWLFGRVWISLRFVHAVHAPNRLRAHARKVTSNPFSIFGTEECCMVEKMNINERTKVTLQGPIAEVTSSLSATSLPPSPSPFPLPPTPATTRPRSWLHPGAYSLPESPGRSRDLIGEVTLRGWACVPARRHAHHAWSVSFFHTKRRGGSEGDGRGMGVAGGRGKGMAGRKENEGKGEKEKKGGEEEEGGGKEMGGRRGRRGGIITTSSASALPSRPSHLHTESLTCLNIDLESIPCTEVTHHPPFYRTPTILATDPAGAHAIAPVHRL